MSYLGLVNRIHISSSGDLFALKDEIIDNGLYGTGMGSKYSFAYNHVWREFNRNAILKTDNFDELIAGPMDAGFRPQLGVLETGNFSSSPATSNVVYNGDNIIFNSKTLVHDSPESNELNLINGTGITLNETDSSITINAS